MTALDLCFWRVSGQFKHYILLECSNKLKIKYFHNLNFFRECKKYNKYVDKSHIKKGKNISLYLKLTENTMLLIAIKNSLHTNDIRRTSFLGNVLHFLVCFECCNFVRLDRA